ncbi:hypothetical protein AEGHOMDF_5985 [Methylobacterium soli]|nr:hypothetical protein AEGHOMDF_5985 [Methylobacterium soli]
MGRDQRHLVARGDEDRAIVRQRIVRRGERPVELEGRVDQRVVRVHGEPVGHVFRADLEALATGRRHVHEVAAGRVARCRQLENVIRQIRPEGADLIIDEAAVVEVRQRAAEADLVGLTGHLLERRIGHQRVRQEAGPQRVGAGEFERRRRAVRLGIAAIERQAGAEAIGQAGQRVDLVEVMRAGHVRRETGQVLRGDAGEVEARAGRQREGVGQVDRVGGVEAHIEVRAGHRTRRDAEGARGAQEVGPEARDVAVERVVRVRGHRQVGIDHAERARRLEAVIGRVDRTADHEAVVEAEHAVAIGGLQRAAIPGRFRLGHVEGAVGHARGERDAGGARIPAEEQELVAEGELRLAGRGAEAVILEAEPAAEARTRAAILEIAVVAVDILLAEAAEIGVPGEIPGRRDVDPAGQLQGSDFGRGGLRVGEDRARVAVGEVDRGGGGGAEIGPGQLPDQVELGIGRAIAEVAVDAAERARALIAPAAVVQPVAREVDAPGADHLAVLERARGAGVRAAERGDLGALPGEAVLHLDVDGAAERVEAEDRIARHDVDAVDRDLRDQIQVDGVAEGLVDAHAVLVDRQTLRHAGHRRGLEAAIVDVDAVVVALRIREVQTGHAPSQRIDRVEGRPIEVEVGGRHGFDGAGDLVERLRTATQALRARHLQDRCVVEGGTRRTDARGTAHRGRRDDADLTERDRLLRLSRQWHQRHRREQAVPQRTHCSPNPMMIAVPLGDLFRTHETGCPKKQYGSASLPGLDAFVAIDCPEACRACHIFALRSEPYADKVAIRSGGFGKARSA